MITSNNHTQMPNEIIDVFMKQLSDKAFKVLSVICRKTIGWHKETDSISASQIVSISGLSRSSVLRSIKELEDLKLIIVDRDIANYSTNKYTINYTLSDTCVTERQGGCQADTGGGVTETHTKETILNKDINKASIKRPDLFEIFWNRYDKKINRVSTVKQWNKLSDIDKQKAIDSITSYHEFRKDKTYRKYPERYLSERIFDEEFVSTAPTNTFKDYK